MLKSELEKAASDHVDTIYGDKRGCNLSEAQYIFESGVKWALEWVKWKSSSHQFALTTEVEVRDLEIEEDAQSVVELRNKHGISSENRSGSKEEAEILSGKRISEKEK